MSFQFDQLAFGTAVAVGLAVAGIMGSAPTIKVSRDRPPPSAQESPHSDMRPAPTVRLDEYQRLRGSFIDPMSGRPR